MKRFLRQGLTGILIALVLALAATASDAELFFSTDSGGQIRVTNIQEGAEFWIAVSDPDENTDCDVREIIWTEINLFDQKTGAEISWVSYLDGNGDAQGVPFPNDNHESYRGHSLRNPGSLDFDYLVETGPDTGVFISNRPFQLGTRENYDVARQNTHVVCNSLFPGELWLRDFSFGGEDRIDHVLSHWTGNLTPDDGQTDQGLADDPVLPDAVMGNTGTILEYVVGRFENMDTIVGIYTDPNDAADIAVGLMKIDDVEASIEWDRQVYTDGESDAMITVSDWDENLNCNQVEYVPVFILVNPGSWNPVKTNPDSPTTFCSLKRTGGVDGADGTLDDRPGVALRWYSMYHSWRNSSISGFGAADDRYYIEYPTGLDNNTTTFDTRNPDGITAVSFYAQETGTDTGVFQLNLNNLAFDLGFNTLKVRDVLVAYYLDPNDHDDFKLATATIEVQQHSTVRFTDANSIDKDLYWIGRDPVYVQVVDGNANVDPCCPEQVLVHICDPHGEDDAEWRILDELSSNSPVFASSAGMQLLPVWNAMGLGLDPITRDGFQLQLDNWILEVFNEDDVYARYNDVVYEAGANGWLGLGDSDLDTEFPPEIDRVRVDNDVSFDLMSIADTQVYDGQTTNMWFLDRQGNRVSEYTTSDCVFIEVLDPDQNEDQFRRERISTDWDDEGELISLCNIRSMEFIDIDLLETGAGTGDFVSVDCIDLATEFEGAPSLNAQPGDTILAFYQDPSNHSDVAMISIRVGVGGDDTPQSQQSTTLFVDAENNEVTNYSDTDDIFVRVVDPSHAGAAILEDAVSVEGVSYDLQALDADGAFVTAAINLGLISGQTITATYTDPSDPSDSSSHTISALADHLEIEAFVVGPNPFDGEATFSYEGTGVAAQLMLAIYDLSGALIQELSSSDATEITWDGTKGSNHIPVANGCYVYVITATDGTNLFSQTDKVFINR